MSLRHPVLDNLVQPIADRVAQNLEIILKTLSTYHPPFDFFARSLIIT